MLSQHPRVVRRFAFPFLAALILSACFVAPAAAQSISPTSQQIIPGVEPGVGAPERFAEAKALLEPGRMQGSPQAAPDGVGRISGKVTDRVTGQPLANIKVQAYLCGGNCYYEDDVTATGTDGTYSLDLTPETYQLIFNDPAGIYAHVIVNDVMVAAEQTAQTDVQMSIRGGFSGLVTAAGTGEPLAGIEVHLLSLDGESMALPTATTDAQGVYTAGGLEDGDYQIGFRDPGGRYQAGAILTEDGKQLLPVRVAAESITPHVDVALVEGGHVAGTVSDAKTGLPLAGIRVTFQANTGPAWSTWSTGYESATTGADGTYISGGLATNSYCVEFYDPDDQYPFLRCYGSEPYGGLDDSFVSVMVTAPQTTGGIDARLVKWGQVAGLISDKEYDRPLPGIHVVLEVYYWDSDPVHRPRGWSWGRVAEQDSTADGRYHFDRLYDRIFRVRFSDPAGIYHAETIDIGQLSGHPDATHVNVALDLHERVTGHIAGTATVRWTGAPAADVEVNVLQFAQAAVVASVGVAQDRCRWRLRYRRIASWRLQGAVLVPTYWEPRKLHH